MKYTRLHQQQSGFTIVELMVATLVFAVILVVVTSGVLHFTTDYYKGINSSTTQTAGANIINNVAQALQLSKSDNDQVSLGSTGGYLCAGNKEFVYLVGNEEPTAPSGFYMFNYDGTCYTLANYKNSPAWTSNQYQDLLQPHMRLTGFDVSGPSGVNNDTWTINVGVAYGDYDLLCDTSQNGHAGGCGQSDAAFSSVGSAVTDIQNSPNITANLHCKSETGSQFCDVVNLSTLVQSRL